MPNTSFRTLIEEDKKNVIIFLLKDDFEIELGTSEFYKIEIENYKEAIEKNNLKLLTLKFFLPKENRNCVIIYSKEIRNGISLFSFLKKDRKWLYKITNSDETIDIYQEKELDSEFLNILNGELDVRETLKIFFEVLGFKNIFREKISQQKTFMEEVRINA